MQMRPTEIELQDSALVILINHICFMNPTKNRPSE